jgi:hypothetical protein
MKVGRRKKRKRRKRKRKVYENEATFAFSLTPS